MTGAALSVEEAFKLGAAMFGDLLDDDAGGAEPAGRRH